jgi:hypothetical protein
MDYLYATVKTPFAVTYEMYFNEQAAEVMLAKAAANSTTPISNEQEDCFKYAIRFALLALRLYSLVIIIFCLFLQLVQSDGFDVV